MGGMDAELAMATTQALTPSASNSSISGGRGGIRVDSTPSDSFPVGLRVLVVDDDPICLLILDRMLRRCMYQVTTCGKATVALEMLRENKSGFDLIISDVCMPDMDGFKLLELVGLEMDLPVIMMSANGETSAVMKGIKHGACDYLLKPVRIEELRNIWQHVVRKRWRAAASHEDDKHKRVADDADYSSSANEGSDGVWKQSKKRKDSKEDEDDADNDNDDPSSTTKKPRVVWSVDLHQQFVAAVNQLGIDKAVPKRILELMNVQGLTRENVASHLQKYRLYLKRISGVAHQPGGLNSSFAGSPDSNFGAVGASGLGGLGDLRSLAATGQLSPEALMSTLQAGLLGRLGPPNNFGIGNVDHSLLLQVAALQGANSGALTRPSYGQSALGNQGNLQAGSPDLKQLTHSSQQRVAFGQMVDKGPTGMSSLQQQQLAAAVGLGGMAQLVGMNSNLQVDPNNSALMMQALQQQAGGHSTNGGGLNLPTRAPLGQHGLLTEIGPWASSPSNVNSVNAGIGTGVAIQNACSLKPGPVATLVGTGSSSPNILGALGRTSGVDSKGLQIPSMGHANLSLPSPVVSSPSAGIGLDSDLTAARMKNIGSSLGVSSEGSLQTPGSFGSNFTSLSGMKHGQGLHVGQRNRTGWQGPGLSQEFGQGNSPVLSPRYSQASSINQGLIMSSGQEQGQLRAPGFNMGFPGNLNLDGGRLKACLGNTSSQSELSTAESDLKVKEESLSLLMGVKAERGFLPVPLSDDLLNVLLKQQQDGLGLTEGELSSADGYAANNMYVK